MDEQNPSTRPRRAYDASGRRRAAEQRRLHVALVAAELFAARGWTATTIAGVAEAAGVSPELVQRTFDGKSGLLMAALRQVSFNQDVNVRELLASMHLEEEPDRERRLDAIVGLACRVMVRMAPMVPVLLHAAAQDEGAKAAYQRARDGHWLMAQDIVGLLATGPVPADAVDEVSVLALAETYLAFTHDLGWTTERYAAWLRRALLRAVEPQTPPS